MSESIVFFDAPNQQTTPRPPRSTLAFTSKTAAAAQLTLTTSWDKWFAHPKNYGVPGRSLNVTREAIIACMAADGTNNSMPIEVYQGFLEMLVQCDPNTDMLYVTAPLATAPSHQRKSFGELLSVPIALAAALENGYVDFVSRADFDALWPAHYGPWVNRWQGKAPDYLMTHMNGGLSFYEIKGVSSHCLTKPRAFGANKTQSINATLGTTLARHLLAYTYLPAGSSATRPNICVQWFNAEPGNPEPEAPLSPVEQLLHLTVGLGQLKRQLASVGRSLQDVLDDSAHPGFVSRGRDLVEAVDRDDKGPRLLISHRAVKLFARHASLLQYLRMLDPLVLLDSGMQASIADYFDQLMELRRRAQARGKMLFAADSPPFKVLHGYKNGTSLISPS
ncbi:hypothetical protein [Achromobacter insuavis]|uniref:hypothetical protein n=1 Tax=Achromobacter insuavis TaxID=1287735 RepID=UPI001F12E47E|nr:hypothetical protein [Achromobacter insuavis]